MKLDFIKLEDLKISPINVRKHGDVSGDDLVPSIKSLGVFQPLLVRKNCEGYEIIAGQRRFNACQTIAKSQVIDPIPCAIMEKGDDVKAIEASLAENIARLPMDELDQYEAFLSLTKQGQLVDDIAAHFGVTEKLVRQRLAIANLYDPILNAYRREEIDLRTIRLLTMASTKQQKAWFKLFKNDEAPTWNLKSWLFGGDEIPTDNALFDLETYKGVITSDLFGEESYFADPALFWEYQSKAIAEIKLELEEDGWREVILLDVGENWSQWEHAEVSKEDGGKVYIRVRPNGEVKTHEGLLPEKEAKRLALAGSGEEPVKAERPELTQSMQNYLDLHRQAAVRAELLNHQGVALRLAIAQIIAGSSLLQAHADPQKANTEAIKESLKSNKAEDFFCEERQIVMKLLGMEGNNNDTLVYRKDDWGKSHNLLDIYAKLLPLSDDEVVTILTFVTAETLNAGSDMVEVLGEQLSVDMSNHWTLGDTATQTVFFDLFRDKEAINAMLQDIGGKVVAEGNLTATAKVQKQIIKDHLSGTRKCSKANWKPRYMAFPMKGYTKRQNTIAAVSRA